MTDLTPTQPFGDHDRLIRIETKLDTVIECLEGQAGWNKAMEERERALEDKASRHSETIQAIKTDVGRLQTVSNTWNILNSAAIAIATFLGFAR
jgi:hypothetical protein